MAICSSIIGIHFVDSLNKHYSYWPKSKVHQTLICMSYTIRFVVIPLLNTAE